MRNSSTPRLGATVLALVAALAIGLPDSVSAQMPAKPAVSAASSSSAVTALQRALASQGIPVKVDGVLGPSTRDAIKAFQTQHHLPVTGEPDQATLAKLGMQRTAQAAPPSSSMARGAMHRHASSQGGMMQGGMMAHCHEMHKQMQQMMAQMQDMMKSMQAPKPN